MSISSTSPRCERQTKAKPRKSRPVPETAIAVRVPQMCEMLQIGPTKAAEMIRQGIVESTLCGKTRLVSVQSIRRLIDGEAA